jgi:alcohol dehydrogenase
MNLEGLGSWDVALGPVRIVFGVQALDSLGRLAADLGARRVLLVSDPGIRGCGHLDRALAALERGGISARVFDGVEENPTTRHVEVGTSFAREAEVDCIVGLGGGSAMDCAKGINFLLTNGGRMEDYWGRGKATLPMLPSIGVPTTAGTGSEAQSYALITQESTHAKMACGDAKARFRTVVLDPGLAPSVPREVAAATGMDALSHALETYVTRDRNPLSMLFAAESWRLLESNFEEVLAGSEDPEVWGRMLLGAHLAGHAIELSMLGAAHACANPLTARFDVTHGHAVGLMLPHVIQRNARDVGPLYERLATTGGSDPGAPLWERVTELRATAGLPQRLRDCAIPEDCLVELAGAASEQWTASFNPVPLDRDELRQIYEAAY